MTLYRGICWGVQGGGHIHLRIGIIHAKHPNMTLLGGIQPI